MALSPPTRNRLLLILLWIVFYASFTLFLPPLLDDADSVHAEVAREMLQRHDWVTLYANGIRYLEKAPILYWSMALSFKLFGVSTAAARLPIALTVIALALFLERFARQAFASTRAGLYAGLITLSSFGIFIFTRITIPDADVCLWLTLALLAFWTTEQGSLSQPDIADESGAPPSAQRLTAPKVGRTTTEPGAPPSPAALSRAKVGRGATEPTAPLAPALLFATTCALNVLTKGLIGVVFPVAIVALYLLIARGPAGAFKRLRQLHPIAGILTFLVIAAPWHILIGLANPTQGHPAPITFTNHHWLVPGPTEGNVHGWFWFYFVNEHLLRYLNLRVPRDYDTVPLALFWGLVLIWIMPWSAYLYPALKRVPLLTALRHIPWRSPTHVTRHSMADTTRHNDPGTSLIPGTHETLELHRNLGAQENLVILSAAKNPRISSLPSLFGSNLDRRKSARQEPLTPLQKTNLLLGLWAAVPLLFFSLSTRQEYYVLPALPALILLLAAWLAHDSEPARTTDHPPTTRIALTLFVLGTLLSAAILFFLLHTRTPAKNTDLATLLQQNPGDYALSFGHFLDLNAQALGLFRLPLALTAIALFFGTLAHWQLRRRSHPHAANLSLADATFLFLLAAHLGLQIFSPVLSSKALADAIAPQLHPQDLIILHGEYEAGSTLGFYLKRPAPGGEPIHICEGRSSNLWYGSFFPDAPRIFETRQSVEQKWHGPQRIFLWQDPSDKDRPVLPLSPVYVIAASGGKQVLSNQPNH
jgi:4-amino-4-deoxy-L-arabinose transferase-like glycosyltransferase